MTPRLEKILAQIVDNLEAGRRDGGLYQTIDLRGINHLLNDAELQNWSDHNNRAGVTTRGSYLKTSVL